MHLQWLLRLQMVENDYNDDYKWLKMITMIYNGN